MMRTIRLLLTLLLLLAPLCAHALCQYSSGGNTR